MSDVDFDVEGVFDEDYLYFYEEMLTPEHTAAEVDQIAELLGPRDDVLDCPCGHGRIANALAERGYGVTGIDQSALFLERARADAQARGVDVEYVHGDMRELPWHERFDGLVNWFTSFGYFDDETNRAVAQGFHDALRPGGRLVLETFNVLRLAKYLLPAHLIERGDDLMIDKTEFDPEASAARTERIIVRDGRVRRTRFRVRMYTFTELRDLLESAGFESVRPGIEPGTENRLLVVADRPPA
jgi:SAM-dependent methyltransferase